MASSKLPITEPLPSIWSALEHQLDDFRSSDALPKQCEILIVGSGFAGVSTAHHLIQDGVKAESIVLVDARKICSGATGRNGGHIKPDTYYNVPKYEKLYGSQQAAELAKFESSGVLAVKQLVDLEELDCDFNLTRAIDVYMDKDHAKQTIDAYKRLLKAGVVDVKDVAYTDSRDAERVTGVKGAQASFSFTAAHLWPRKMVQGLLSRLIDRGLKVYSHTPINSISQARDDQGYWTATTSKASIKARKVVFATNGFTSSVLPQYQRKIVPVRGACCHITTSLGTNSPHLNNTYSLRHGGANYDYLIPRTDGSIVVGGARQAFLHDKDEWFDSVQEGHVLPGTEAYFTDYMQKHFRGWEGSEAKIERIWSGVMGYTSDFMPHIGQIPGSPGQFIIAGFSGHGMPQILQSSAGLAKLVTGKAADYRATGLPLMFESTRERLDNPRSELEEGFKDVWAMYEKPAKAKL